MCRSENRLLQPKNKCKEDLHVQRGFGRYFNCINPSWPWKLIHCPSMNNNYWYFYVSIFWSNSVGTWCALANVRKWLAVLMYCRGLCTWCTLAYVHQRLAVCVCTEIAGCVQLYMYSGGPGLKQLMLLTVALYVLVHKLLTVYMYCRGPGSKARTEPYPHTVFSVNV